MCTTCRRKERQGIQTSKKASVCLSPKRGVKFGSQGFCSCRSASNHVQSIDPKPFFPLPVKSEVTVIYPPAQPESESLVSEELEVELLLVSESELELEALRRETETGCADSAFSWTFLGGFLVEFSCPLTSCSLFSSSLFFSRAISSFVFPIGFLRAAESTEFSGV